MTCLIIYLNQLIDAVGALTMSLTILASLTGYCKETGEWNISDLKSVIARTCARLPPTELDRVARRIYQESTQVQHQLLWYVPYGVSKRRFFTYNVQISMLFLFRFDWRSFLLFWFIFCDLLYSLITIVFQHDKQHDKDNLDKVYVIFSWISFSFMVPSLAIMFYFM